jgi:hypothetical protein
MPESSPKAASSTGAQATDRSPVADEGRCRHGFRHDGEPHGCPYQQEINDSTDDAFCTCCRECEQDCRDDI